MNEAALDTLVDTARALNAALDGDDPRAIERATTDYAGAINAVRDAGGWRDRPDLRDRLAEARTLADMARTRVNILSDVTRQRLNLLTAAVGRAPRVGYGRDGRLR